MTPEQLRALIAAGETLTVGFEGEGHRALADDDLVEAAVCLANRPGDQPAWLLVGVEDDGTVTGARPRHADGTDVLRLQALFANRTTPSLSVRVEVVPCAGREVIVCEVPASATPVGTIRGKYLRRGLGGDGRPACVPMAFHEMQSRQADRGATDFSALEVQGASWDDLDPLEFERFRRLVRETRRGDQALAELPDQELAKAIGAVAANGDVRAVRVLGMLLFGREASLRRLVPAHEAAFQVLAGTEVVVNDFVRWPLLRTMEDFLGRLRARNGETELMVGLLRIGIPDYSEAAFREALANALVHRDYARLGAVHVQWHADHVAIGNPGGFPDGVRLDNILVTQPRPRNPLLADALERCGLVERTGRGVDRIFYEQLRNGRPAPSYARSTESSVVVVLPGGPANLAFTRFVVEETRDNLDDLLLLNALWQERTIDTTQAAALLQKPEAEARSRLQRLTEQGLVEARGERRGRSFHLSASTYRRLGGAAAYVRQRGFEPLQQEQMVLQFVAKGGTISRAEAAELCKLSPPQASRLLTKLLRQGRLIRLGAAGGRGVRYRATTPNDPARS